MKITIRHGAALACDAPRCKARFTSYSVASIVREQAASAGWSRVPAWQVAHLSDSPRIKKDVCPVHTKDALRLKAERPAILAAERAQAKADRIELRRARLEVSKAEKTQARVARDLERAAKAADRAAQKTIDRARRKATKLETKVRGARVHVASVPA